MESLRREIYSETINFLYDKHVNEKIEEKPRKYITFILFRRLITEVYDGIRTSIYDDLFRQRGNK